ncbi:insulinase family protein [Oceanirhabdus sp. W0125-5]|uniref:insulinase family protein n=1 Tax=Oceanirhabdus sp. W0125-5 TaxID=2999116 RepID=UPI0022F323BE|nr:insulinase family protein [Oceanirhabdus sp. W0125-5]WBW97275.1 insulinase family protein [Oceanirhabdus sp. W0125-5]
MQFEINKTYHGFKLIDQYEINEINSIAKVFEHEKSGARLLHLGNDDDNKVFSISFRTPPSDSTGVPHIIEHCVLSGSRKYLTKEPFMDMVKGSLKTFINAMTFNDKTMYPIASRNEKDFYNLMDVYLDAVFYPKIYEVPEIFMQEGWHYDIHNKDEKITYKGVVYNEMLGAYSSPTTILAEEIAKSLLPDTCYKYSSGGNPDVIPDLTFEDFKDFHRKFYHPSNSYIYLYGNGDIEKQLEFINDEYLSNFERKSVDSALTHQTPFNEKKECEAYYAISEDEPAENRTYLSANFVFGEYSDAETCLMIKILENLLIESSAAPLKKALIDNGIGEDILFFDNDSMQPSISFVAKHTNEDKKDEFENIIFSTLKTLVAEGIDRKLIESCINIVEYNLREADNFPTKGIIYNIMSLESWLYDSHPTTHLTYEKTLNDLREKMNTGYFEKFIEDNIINNTHSSIVVMKPKKGLNEEKAVAVEKKLAEYKASLSQEQLNKLIEENTILKEKQLSPDTPEALATIPKLSVSDVDAKAEVIPQEVIKEDDVTLLFHNIFSNNISYVDFLFDVRMMDEELVPYITLLSDILGDIDTESYTYSELSNEIYINTGGIDLSTAVYVENGNDKVYYPKFILSGKAIGDKTITLLNLMKELATSSKFDDKKRIKELIQQIKSKAEMNIYNRGNSVVSKRVSSYFSPASGYSEKLNGLDYFWFICDTIENFDNNSDKILANLSKVYESIFNINNLIISFTGDKKDFDLFRENYTVVTSTLNKNKIEPKVYDFKETRVNEGIQSSSNVQYVAKGFNYKNLGYDYNGSMNVLRMMLNGEYLHDRVRAKGGAYGVGIGFTRSGDVTIASYRDPNLKETLKVYDAAAEYIKNLSITQDDLTKFIIGAMSGIDRATTPHMKGEIATENYIRSISQEDIQRERDELLNTKPEDINALSELVEKSMEMDFCCVLGNDNKIKENEEVFNTLVKLNK